MKILGLTSSDRCPSVICELTDSEMDQFVGPRERRVGSTVNPLKRVELANDLINRVKVAGEVAKQLRALAELIDTVAPGIDAIVNPQPVADPALVGGCEPQ